MKIIFDTGFGYIKWCWHSKWSEDEIICISGYPKKVDGGWFCFDHASWTGSDMPSQTTALILSLRPSGTGSNQLGQRSSTSSRDRPGRTNTVKASTGECAMNCWTAKSSICCGKPKLLSKDGGTTTTPPSQNWEKNSKKLISTTLSEGVWVCPNEVIYILSSKNDLEGDFLYENKGQILGAEFLKHNWECWVR